MFVLVGGNVFDGNGQVAIGLAMLLLGMAGVIKFRP